MKRQLGISIEVYTFPNFIQNGKFRSTPAGNIKPSATIDRNITSKISKLINTVDVLLVYVNRIRLTTSVLLAFVFSSGLLTFPYKAKDKVHDSIREQTDVISDAARNSC